MCRNACWVHALQPVGECGSEHIPRLAGHSDRFQSAQHTKQKDPIDELLQAVEESFSEIQVPYGNKSFFIPSPYVENFEEFRGSGYKLPLFKR